MTFADATAAARSTGAIGLILLAMAAFAVQDTTVKVLADSVSLWQIQLIRSVATLVLLITVGRSWLRGTEIFPKDWRWPVARSAFMCGAYLCFYASLPLLSLSQAASAFYIGPLLITVFAGIFLRERVGPRRIAAVVAGFVGVLLIVRPWGEEVRLAALLPVVAAACYAMGIILTRWRCQGYSALSLTVTHNILYSGIGAVALVIVSAVPIAPESREAYPFIATGWHDAGALAFALIVLTAGTHVTGMMASVGAYRGDEASRIAPFEYVYLAMMPVLDLAVFGQWPDLGTLAGMALISAAGAFVAWREARIARSRAEVADPSWTAPEEAGR